MRNIERLSDAFMNTAALSGIKLQVTGMTCASGVMRVASSTA